MPGYRVNAGVKDKTITMTFKAGVAREGLDSNILDGGM